MAFFNSLVAAVAVLILLEDCVVCADVGADVAFKYCVVGANVDVGADVDVDVGRAVVVGANVDVGADVSVSS